MGVSRAINDLLANSIETYVDDDRYIVEAFAQNTADVEERQDIPIARIAIYEAQESTIEEKGRGRPTMSLQNYSVDISVVRAYRGDKSDEADYWMLDVMDLIKEWVKEVDSASITNGALYNLRYLSSTDAVRNERYVNRTMTLQGKRDLFFDQKNLPLPVGTLTYQGEPLTYQGEPIEYNE